jgi:membrane-associated protease RseP (regulator of RpoE activity)
MHIEGLLELLQGGLESHKQYVAVKSAKPPPPMVVSELVERELYGKMKPVYGCYHCHHVREAQQALAIKQGKWTPDQFWIWPDPVRLGLVMDQRRQNHVSAVIPGSAAVTAGVKSGDVLVSLSGKKVLTKYDIQWILEKCPGTAVELDYVVSRAGRMLSGRMKLGEAWKVGEPAEYAWRVSNIYTRHMQKYLPTPGLVGETIKGTDRVLHQLRKGEFALKVTRLNYGTHLSGIRMGDVIVSVSGRSGFASAREFFHWCEVLRRQGKDLKLGLLRRGRKMHVMVGLNYLNFPSVEKSPEVMLGFTAQEVGWETGLRVGNVREGSGAERTGLKHGDSILLVDGRKMLSYKALEEHLNLKLPGDLLTLKIKRGGKELDVAYVLADKKNEKSDLAMLSAEVTKAGQKLTCVVSINLQEGDHVYSVHKKGFGLPTRLEFRGKGYKVLGGVEEPDPVEVKDGGDVMWIHEGSLLFKQRIVVTDPDNFNLVLRVYAQVCDDQQCSELRSVISNRGQGVGFSEHRGDFDRLPVIGE